MTSQELELLEEIARRTQEEGRDSLNKIIAELIKENVRLKKVDDINQRDLRAYRNLKSNADQVLQQLQENAALAEKLDKRALDMDKAEAILAAEVKGLGDRLTDAWRMLELLLGNRRIREKAQERIPVDLGSNTMQEWDPTTGSNRTVVMPAGENLEDVESTTETEEA